jgi:hypothetical protein
MHLLDTKTLQSHEFVGTNIPPYAILSHTWGEDEVTFQDMERGNPQSKAGYDKVRRCCEMAAADGFSYAWVDTCCIDKTSSAELSEAINSMYRWYRLADVCYAYLADVPSDGGQDATIQSIQKSRWFTRGWTLQELIAPQSLIFLDNQWRDIGTKQSLGSLISEITFIDEEILRNAENLTKFSVAQKISWASNRDTTRVEDLAYCLMGLFGVNMPLLYGEGSRSFIRLQEEILKTGNDATIFAWTHHMDSAGLLADTPKYFRGSRKFINSYIKLNNMFTLTNNAFQFVNAFTVDISDELKFPYQLILVLDCYEIGEAHAHLGIYLKRNYDGIFYRVRFGELGRVNLKPFSISTPQRQDILVQQRHVYDIDYPLPSYKKHFLMASIAERTGVAFQESYPDKPAYSEDGTRIVLHEHMVQVRSTYQSFCAFRFTDNDDNGFILILMSRNDRRVLSGLSLTVEVLEHTKQPLEKLWIWKGGAERLYWKHPLKIFNVSVEVKRQIIAGERAEVAFLNVH